MKIDHWEPRSDGNAPVQFEVRDLKGKREAIDVQVLFRCVYRMWYARCSNLGPEYESAAAEGVYVNVLTDLPEQLMLWGLPAKPFYEKDGTSSDGRRPGSRAMEDRAAPALGRSHPGT